MSNLNDENKTKEKLQQESKPHKKEEKKEPTIEEKLKTP